ncbi:DUF3919 family protein [Heyndrickxia coagulans]|uniref:DUF3919 family protein n=1 Tax=Heyndrickxia coagulans TaxID=1398 RepID=UPI003D21CFF2
MAYTKPNIQNESDLNDTFMKHLLAIYETFSFYIGGKQEMPSWYKYIGYFLIIIVFFLLVMYFAQNSFYDKVRTIDDKDEVFLKSSESIPVRVSVKNSIWGENVIEDEINLQNFVTFMQIVKSEGGKAKQKSCQKNQDNFSGEVTYLNGDKYTFSIGNSVILHKRIYCSTSVKSLAESYKADLLQLYYKPDKIALLLQKCSEVIALKNGQEMELSQEKVKLVSEQMKSSPLLTDYDQITKLLYKHERAQAFIIGYVNGKHITNSRSDVIHISVYPTFSVFQYLGDDKGNVVYLQGSLLEAI